MGPASTLNTPGIDWSSTRGAFALEGKLYKGANNGTFSVRSFDGSSVGPAQQIELHGLTDFNLQSVTGMFYADGRIYYTVQGDPQMYYRYFTPESRIVGSFRFSVPGGAGDWSDVRGITFADGKIFFARTDGNLYSMEFSSGSPVGGTEALVSPKSDGYDWASNGLFAFTHVEVDITAPTAPGKPTGSSPGTGTITINWAASQDASPPITYRVYRDTDLVNRSPRPPRRASPTPLAPGPSTPTRSTRSTSSTTARPSVRPRIRSRSPRRSSPTTSPPGLLEVDQGTRMTIDDGSGGVAPPSAMAQTSAQTAFAFKNLATTYPRSA